MSATGGYQSDLNLSEVVILGDFPLDHLVGGYGSTSGVDNYTLTLSPAITSLRPGMVLYVDFTQVNTGPATLNTNSTGAQAIKKLRSGVKIDLQVGDLGDKIAVLFWDGVDYQLVNPNDEIPKASETLEGFARFATQVEVTAGVSPSLMVSAQNLAQYVSDKITGLWEDKGVIDASTSPNYPAGSVGDAYTISVAGKIGGPSGVDVQLRDVVYCTADNPGGDHATVGSSWNVIQTNLEQATESLAGYMRLASDTELSAGVLNNVGISPFRLVPYIANLLSNKEDFLGLPAISGHVLQSTTAGERSWIPVPKILYTNLVTASIPTGTAEEDIGSTYTLAANTLRENSFIEINISGTLVATAFNKTLRVHFGVEEIFSQALTAGGDYSLKILASRSNTDVLKGSVQLLIDGSQPVVQLVETTNLDLDTTSQLIRFTGQNALSQSGSITRTTLLIRHHPQEPLPA